MSDSDELLLGDTTTAEREENPTGRRVKAHRRERDDEEMSEGRLAALRAGIAGGSGSDSDDEDIHDFDAAEDEESVDGGAGGGFLDVAADDGTDEDEVVDEAARQREIEESRYIREHKTKRGFFEEGDEELDDEELARRLNEKYKLRQQQQAQQRAAPSGMGFSAAVLPRPTDPKVFAVKVRPGFARTLVTRIVNKCHAYLRGDNQQGIRQDLGIISAFSVDHVREWIYLESHRKRFVETAINGLEHVFRFKINQVDPKELMQLLERQVSSGEELQVGQYVRVKSGPYQNDIAVVTEVSNEGTRAQIKLVPREDFFGRTHRQRAGRNNQALRHPQKLFVPQQATGATVYSDGASSWDGLRFTAEGYLLRELPARSLFAGAKCEPPTIDELIAFHGGDHEQVESAAAMLKISVGKKKQVFKPDEPVRVATGQLAGVIGRVRETDLTTGRAKVETLLDNQRQVVNVNIADLARYLEPGSHVIIEKGEHAGESGTVLVADKNMVIVVTDGTDTELYLEADHCRSSKLAAARPHKVGAHELFDLVSLADDKTVGCIAGFAGSHVMLVTPENTVSRVLLTSIKQTIREKASVTDGLGNTVTRRETVTVGDGHGVQPQYVRLNATVLQVHKGTLFLVSSAIRENAGVFAINAKHVMRLEGKNKLRRQSDFVNSRNREREAHPAKLAKARAAAARSGVMSSVVGSVETAAALGGDDLR